MKQLIIKLKRKWAFRKRKVKVTLQYYPSCRIVKNGIPEIFSAIHNELYNNYMYDLITIERVKRKDLPNNGVEVTFSFTARNCWYNNTSKYSQLKETIAGTLYKTFIIENDLSNNDPQK